MVAEAGLHCSINRRLCATYIQLRLFPAKVPSRNSETHDKSIETAECAEPQCTHAANKYEEQIFTPLELQSPGLTPGNCSVRVGGYGLQAESEDVQCD